MASRGGWFKVRVGIGLVVLAGVGLQFVRVKRAEAWRPDWRERLDVTVLLLHGPLQDDAARSVIERVQRDAVVGEDRPTFPALEDWFAQERARYGGLPPVKLHLTRPLEVPDLPPAPPAAGEALSFMDRYRRTHAFLDWFAAQRARVPTRKGATVFVLFVPVSELPRIASQHSVADRRSRSGFVFAPLTEQGADHALIDAAHELLHLFGATDKYDGDRCVFPQGFVEPHREPRYPQRFAEVMAQGIPQAQGGREQGVSYFESMRVGVETAWEVGWIDQPRRDRYYGGDVGAEPAFE